MNTENFRKWIPLVSIVVIMVAGFLVYSNTLGAQFVWDDEYLIKRNTYIKNWGNIPKIFSEDIAAGAGRMYNSFRPLQMFTYLIDYSLWGLDPKGYHLANVLFHVLAAVCVYLFISVLYGDRLLSFLTGLFFAVHPVHTEAVAYVSGRSDSLAAVFLLLSFIFYIKNLQRERISLYLLMSLSFVLALLSRENTLILPVLLGLYHYAFKKEFKVKPFLPVAGVASVYILLRFTFLKDLLTHTVSPTTLSQRIPGFFIAMTSYVRLLIAPVNLHMEYGLKVFQYTDPAAIVGVFIVIFLLVYAFRKRNANRWFFFAVCWFFLTLFPVSNIYPVNAYMAEHWLYLPSIGFFLVLSVGLSAMFRVKNLKYMAVVLISVLFAFYCFVTFRQNTHWKDPLSLHKLTIKYASDSAIVHINLGNAYQADGRTEDAINEYKKAAEISPRYAKAWNNLGFMYQLAGKRELAIKNYKKALEVDPNYVTALNNLGNIYYGMGNIQEAIATYNRSLKIDPNSPMAYYNLGNAYFRTGKRDEAIGALKKAVELDPDHADAYNNLGMIYRIKGNRGEAIKMFKKAVEIVPNYARGHYNLAVSYYQNKQYDLAKIHAEKARQLGYKVNPAFMKELQSYP